MAILHLGENYHYPAYVKPGAPELQDTIGQKGHKNALAPEDLPADQLGTW